MIPTRRSLRAATAAITATALLSGLPVAQARIRGELTTAPGASSPACSLSMDDSSRQVFDRFIQDINTANSTAVQRSLEALTGDDVDLRNQIIEHQKAHLPTTGGDRSSREAELTAKLVALGATKKEAALWLDGGLKVREDIYTRVLSNSQPPALSDPAQLKKGPKELANTLTWDDSELVKVLSNPFADAAQLGPNTSTAYAAAAKDVASAAAALKEVYTLQAYKQGLKDCADKLPADDSTPGGVVVRPAPEEPTVPAPPIGTTPDTTPDTNKGSSTGPVIGLGVLIALGVALARLMPFLKDSGIFDKLPQLPLR